ALDAVDEKACGFRVIELGELFLDQVEAFDRSDVIILIVADDQPLGHALDVGRVARQRLDLVTHQRSSGANLARLVMTLPPGDKESSPRRSRLPASGSSRPWNERSRQPPRLTAREPRGPR